MSRVVTDVVSVDVLKEIITYHWSKNEGFGQYFEKRVSKGIDPVKFLLDTDFRSGVKSLTAKVCSDLSKVQFDTENLEWENGEGFDDLEDITGFHTLSNGISYLGFCSGGDWESPLFGCIYWSGTELRGYIPTGGNTWNTDTKKAYGNGHEDTQAGEDDEEVDNRNAKKRFGVDEYRNASGNKLAILEDIQKRITLCSGATVKPKGMDDIDWEAIDIRARNQGLEDDGGDDDEAKDCGCGCDHGDNTAVAKIATGCNKLGGVIPCDPPPSNALVLSVDPKILVDELNQAEEMCKDLVRWIGELRSHVESKSPLAREKAGFVRDIKLREFVSRLVKTTLGIEHMD